MRIAFLCSSLGEGRDGVGDYVRNLASACEAVGHACLLVALNDKHLPDADVRASRSEIRIPTHLSWAARADRLGSALDAFGPDWVSWQLVPYGFDPKGIIPFPMARLAEAARPWPGHAMLHELWVGISRNEGARARMVGALQKHCLTRLLGQVRPSRVHTSNAAYQAALRQAGWESAVLPLFGNIPIVPIDREAAAAQLRVLAGLRLPAGPLTVGVLFGTIHPEWDPRPVLASLQEAARATGRRIALIAVGRIGAHGSALLARLADGDLVSSAALGELPARQISTILRASDFALSAHPWALTGKSGTIATLLEHGLPVLVSRDDWSLRGRLATPGPGDPLLYKTGELGPGGFGAVLARRREPAPRLPEIAARFCADLVGHAVAA
jgi:hypothetical protein